MAPGRREQIERLYQTALRLEESKRGAFLEEASAGDDELRREVALLLASEGQREKFIEARALEVSDGAPGAESSTSLLGRQIGSYKILSLLGAGGMGKVYKAQDARLNRPVAIKTLLESTPLAPDGVASLRKEALAIAFIDHPYICKVYELLEAEGQTFIVMEFVEGETLAQVLNRGTLSVQETVHYASEIGEAVSEAHTKYIVHRDIKPANIMITPHRHVKVMDFGIAKVRRDRAVDSLEPTTDSAPFPHFIGTPWYMSPEQALGEPVDHRSDIFSIGILIFQCLTGTLPFEGDTKQTYLGNLVAQPPRSLRSLRPDVPDRLEQIVLRCLQKDPALRFDTAESLGRELSIVSEMIHTPSESLPFWIAPRIHRIGIPLAVSALAFLGLLLAYWFFWARGQKTQVAHKPVSLAALVTWPSAESNSRISPDAQWFSFLSDRSGRRNIWLANRSGGEPLELPTQEGTILSHVWSPDGKELAYLIRQESKVFIQITQAFFGGPPRLSVEVPSGTRTLVRWAGNHIYMEMRGALQMLDLGTAGQVEAVWSNRGNFVFPKHFDVRADEKKVVFSGMVQGQEDLWESDLDGGHAQRITSDPFRDRYPLFMGQDGKRVVYQSNRGGQVDLWQIALSDRSILQITSSGDQENPDDVSGDGTLLTFEGTRENANLWSLGLHSSEKRQLTADALNDIWPSVAARSAAIVFQRSKPSLEGGLEYLDDRILVGTLGANALRSQPQQVAEGFSARLSRDGAWLTFLKRIPDNPQLLELWVTDVKNLVSRRLSERFPNSGYLISPPDWHHFNRVWSIQGNALFFVESTGDDAAEIKRIQLDSTSSEPELVLSVKGAGATLDLGISSSGRFLSYTLSSAQSSQIEIHAYDLESKADHVVMGARKESPEILYAKGWLKSDHEIIVLRARMNSNGTQSLEIVQADLAGTVQVVGSAKAAFAATARLDSASETLYLTGSEGGIHNIYAYSLAKRQFHRLTDNVLPGITFSGIEPAPEGRLVYSRTERKQDIWMIQFER